MTFSTFSFLAKVILLSGVMGAAIKYALPTLLGATQAGQNDPALGVVLLLLIAPSAFMGGLFWLGRSSASKS